jgi:hypothetical protein
LDTDTLILGNAEIGKNRPTERDDEQYGMYHWLMFLVYRFARSGFRSADAQIFLALVVRLIGYSPLLVSQCKHRWGRILA